MVFENWRGLLDYCPRLTQKSHRRLESEDVFACQDCVYEIAKRTSYVQHLQKAVAHAQCDRLENCSHTPILVVPGEGFQPRFRR